MTRGHRRSPTVPFNPEDVAAYLDGQLNHWRSVRDGSVTTERVNEAYRDASMSGPLHGYLGYSDEPLVSIDYKGNPNSCTIDALSTAVIGDDLVKVVGWYDNEWGYACRTADLAAFMAEKGV